MIFFFIYADALKCLGHTYTKKICVYLKFNFQFAVYSLLLWYLANVTLGLPASGQQAGVPPCVSRQTGRGPAYPAPSCPLDAGARVAVPGSPAGWSYKCPCRSVGRVPQASASAPQQPPEGGVPHSGCRTVGTGAGPGGVGVGTASPGCLGASEQGAKGSDAHTRRELH